jgi:hypothetical protein
VRPFRLWNSCLCSRDLPRSRNNGVCEWKAKMRSGRVQCRRIRAQSKVFGSVAKLHYCAENPKIRKSENPKCPKCPKCRPESQRPTELLRQQGIPSAMLSRTQVFKFHAFSPCFCRKMQYPNVPRWPGGSSASNIRPNSYCCTGVLLQFGTGACNIKETAIVRFYTVRRVGSFQIITTHDISLYL